MGLADMFINYYRNHPPSAAASINNPNYSNNFLQSQPSKEVVILSSSTDDNNKPPAQLFVERIRKRYQGLKSDLKIFQDCYDLDNTDLQNLKKLASTMCSLASSMASGSEEYHTLPWLQGTIEKFEEVLKFDAKDYEARFKKGMAHYLILRKDLLKYKWGDLYKDHCKKAFECFTDVKHKAPDVYGESKMLEVIRECFPPCWDPESPDRDKTCQNPVLRVSYPQLKQKMKEDMIQEAVEKLLEAMSIFPDDNNSEVVHKLASQIYFHPWTGNKNVIEYREDLLASAKVAKEALSHDPHIAEKLKGGALALILLCDVPTREMIDPLKTVKGLQDAISMLEKALVIDSNDYEAMFYLGKVYYHLSMDTNHLGFAVCLEHCQKAREYFSKVRDEAPTVYKDSAMVEEVESLLATYSSKFERRDTGDLKRAKIMTNSNLGSASIATDENVMLMKFVGVLFHAMSLGVEEKLKAAGEESAKPRLAQELVSLYRQVEHMMQDMIMKLSESP